MVIDQSQSKTFRKNHRGLFEETSYKNVDKKQLFVVLVVTIVCITTSVIENKVELSATQTRNFQWSSQLMTW